MYSPGDQYTRRKQIIRLSLLIFLTFFLTIGYFKNVGGFLKIDLELEQRDQPIQEEEIREQVKKIFQDKIGNVNEIFKVPATLLSYNIYFFNSILGLEQDVPTATILRVNLTKLDTEDNNFTQEEYREIRSGYREKFNKIVLNDPEQIKYLLVDFSVVLASNPSLDEYKFIAENDGFGFQIRPTFFSFLIVLLSMLFIIYGFILLMYRLYDFVLKNKV